MLIRGCLLYTSRYGDEFEAAMGAEAVQTLLKEIDLDQMSAELTAEVEKSSGQKRVRILKHLEAVSYTHLAKLLRDYLDE